MSHFLRPFVTFFECKDFLFSVPKIGHIGNNFDLTSLYSNYSKKKPKAVSCLSYSYEQLCQMEDNELIKQHDEKAEFTVVGINYFLEELARRDAQRVNNSMLKCTKWITIMTAVMLLATLVNVILAIIR